MNCRDVDRSLMEHDKSVTAQLPAQIQEHLLTCDRCRELVRALNPSVDNDTPTPEILRQLEETLNAELRPVRPLAPTRYLFVAFAAIFFLADPELNARQIEGVFPRLR